MQLKVRSLKDNSLYLLNESAWKKAKIVDGSVLKDKHIFKKDGCYYYKATDPSPAQETVLVVDTNLALELALALGAAGHLVYYAIVHGQPYPRLRDEVSGYGFEEIQKIWDWGEGLELGAEYVIFTDSGFGHLADWLRSKDYYVIGADGKSERLELDRVYARKVMKRLDINVPDGKVIKGVEEVIKAIAQAKRKLYVKINRMRGDIETFGTDDPEEARTLLSKGGFPVFGSELEFVLEEELKGIEVGVDAFFNGREFLPIVADTIEMKGCGNATKFNKIEDSVWFTTLEKFEPWLARNGYYGLFCLEGFYDGVLRVTDVTPRFPYICSYAYPKVIENFDSMLLSLARGEIEAPRLKGRYSVQIGVYTDDTDSWRIIHHSAEPEWIAYRKAVRLEEDWYVPGDPVVAVAVSAGNSLSAAISDAIKRAESFDMQNIYVQGREFASYLNVFLDKAKEFGYAF